MNDNLNEDFEDNLEEGEDTGSYENERSSGYKKQYKPRSAEGQKTLALEVSVDNNIEKALKILKRKLIKEGLFKELKMRRYYEKPSEKKKRKQKESIKKIRKEEARLKKNPYLY